MYYFINKNDVPQEIPDYVIAAYGCERYFGAIGADQWWYVEYKDLAKFRRLIATDRSIIPENGKTWVP